METDKASFDAPSSSAGDKLHLLVRAVLSAVPGVGGPATELFNAIVTPPLERRRQEWMEMVGVEISRLSATRNIEIEHLHDNEAFVSTLMQASQAALRTHQEEKLEALRNAVVNSALPEAPDESTQLIFLNHIDRFTEWHIRILRLFDNPPESSSVLSGALVHVLENTYPELLGHRSFYDQIWKDLKDNGLVNTDSLHVLMTGQGLAECRTTHFGKKFLRFIELSGS